MSRSAIPVTEELLRTMPLPRHQDGEDKDQRGRVLIVAGSVEMPGGAMLSGLGALRAGAGKLRIATCRSIAPHLAVAVPEARVISLGESPAGGISANEAEAVARQIGQCDATLIGPGMIDSEASALLTAGVLERAALEKVPFVRIHPARAAAAERG